MPLIGRNTVTGNFIKCSDLTPDGSTKTFTLTNSKTGDNVYPGDQNSLLVSVSGVIQNPGTSFTINNNQITFTTAPSISDTIDFIIILGDLVAIGTPSDNTVTNAKIVDGTIQNAKLANNSITINGTSISLGASGTIVAGTDWQAVITADGSTATTAVAGEGYFIDTTSNTHTINLPASPSVGDTVSIVDYAGTFATNNVTVGRNGSNIQGAAVNATINTNRQSVQFTYVDVTKGWVPSLDATTGNYGALYTVATGGTVTTSGDYKIHTFTGDGCFVVSQAGNPGGGGSTVDYLVVAGGGSGGHGSDGGGGGGAGGFRESHSTPVSGCYTASPLATPTGITVSATTYPISVGSGGASVGHPVNLGTSGSNSVFSTITSAGGGAGGAWARNPSAMPGGGSGGGGAQTQAPFCGGAGNTPPVNPPQGQPGGGQGYWQMAGGGGATVAGTDGHTSGGTGPGDGPTSRNGKGGGGAGATTSISGSPTAYAGGGGGGVSTWPNPGYDYAPGGTGGGGAGGGGSPACQATSGTANTGGGGGGAPGNDCLQSGAGGSGIVIIRYKYQN